LEISRQRRAAPPLPWYGTHRIRVRRVRRMRRVRTIIVIIVQAMLTGAPTQGLLLEVASYLTRCQHYGEALTHTRHRAPLHLVTPK
jgi:hypothetical protein